MKITTIGRGTIGGTLAQLWTAAGHEVTTLGHDGGDVATADVVLLAVPGSAVEQALAGITGLRGKVVIDATNRLGDEAAAGGADSNAAFIKSQTGGPTAKAFNLNFGNLFEQAASVAKRPTNIWVGDEEARAAVEQLSRDVGFEPVNGGPLEHAAAQEAFARVLIAMIGDLGGNLLFHRFAPPEDL